MVPPRKLRRTEKSDLLKERGSKVAEKVKAETMEKMKAIRAGKRI